jgi:hypothetical protein
MQRKGAAARASDTAASSTRPAAADITRAGVDRLPRRIHLLASSDPAQAVLQLSAPTEPTATALPDAELVPIMAAWLSGFLVDKRRDFNRR